MSSSMWLIVILSVISFKIEAIHPKCDKQAGCIWRDGKAKAYCCQLMDVECPPTISGDPPRHDKTTKTGPMCDKAGPNKKQKAAKICLYDYRTQCAAEVDKNTHLGKKVFKLSTLKAEEEERRQQQQEPPPISGVSPSVEKKCKDWAAGRNIVTKDGMLAKLKEWGIKKNEKNINDCIKGIRQSAPYVDPKKEAKQQAQKQKQYKQKDKKGTKSLLDDEEAMYENYGDWYGFSDYNDQYDGEYGVDFYDGYYYDGDYYDDENYYDAYYKRKARKELLERLDRLQRKLEYYLN